MCVGMIEREEWAARNERRERKSLRNGVHRANAVVRGPHESVDDAVEVKAVVEPAVREVCEVGRGDRHLVHEELRFERSEGGIERRDRVRGRGRGHRSTRRRRLRMTRSRTTTRRRRRGRDASA
eukprot:30829-Pelagococcus_subviridis.AAC.5